MLERSEQSLPGVPRFKARSKGCLVLMWQQHAGPGRDRISAEESRLIPLRTAGMSQHRLREWMERCLSSQRRRRENMEVGNELGMNEGSCQNAS